MVVERRRYERLELALPVEVWKLEAPGEEVFNGALTTNVSRGGAYFESRIRRDLMPGEMVNISVSVPREVRKEFPFSRLVGKARVLRVEEPPKGEEAPPAEQGVAVEVPSAEQGVAVEFNSEFVFLLAMRS